MDTFFEWLHVGAAIMFLGPVTIAMATTPRYVRKGDVAVVRFLHRTTRLYGLLSILVFLFGIELGRNRFDEAWLTASMTLFVVALVLQFALVLPDQRRAIRNLESGEETAVNNGRIIAISSAIGVIYLAVLALMVWQPGA